jgi:hypothetical protein
MLNESFRLVTARLIPGRGRRKRVVPLALLILAGCGGSSTPKAVHSYQRVAGPGFSFRAPAGWKAGLLPGGATATRGAELVRVARFPLAKPYSPALFQRVARELVRRMRAVAAQTGGRLTGSSSVVVDGVRSHVYELAVRDYVDSYTFVLVGKHEFQLLCRRKTSSPPDFCRRLVTSFATA